MTMVEVVKELEDVEKRAQQGKDLVRVVRDLAHLTLLLSLELVQVRARVTVLEMKQK